MSEPTKDATGKDVARPDQPAADPYAPEDLHVVGRGVGGTANKGFPSTAGLTGDNAPVQYSNTRPGGPEEAPSADEGVAVSHRTGMFGARAGGDTSGFGGLQREVRFPGAAQRPYGGYFDEVVDRLTGHAGEGVVERVVVDRGELTLHVGRDQLLQVMRVLRDAPDLRFEMCVSVSGVHYPDQTGSELHAVFHLLSITHGGRRVRIECAVADADPHLPSVVGIYPAADWHERETWDMFGIIFDGHPALTRILMPDDWAGHPQRKDYPLGGVPVEYKGGTVPPPDQRRSYS